MIDHFVWFDPFEGRTFRSNAQNIEVVVRRKPQNPKGWPPITQAQIEACIDAVCGCGGKWDCDCVSVFNRARFNAWYAYTSRIEGGQ